MAASTLIRFPPQKFSFIDTYRMGTLGGVCLVVLVAAGVRKKHTMFTNTDI